MAKSLSVQMKSLKSQQIAQKEKATAKAKVSTPIKEQAKKNAVVSKGSKSAGYETKKAGTPLDQTTKHDILVATDSKFGMNIGVTKNMDNYESLRVDVWATDKLREGESLADGYERMSTELKEALAEVIEEYDE